MVASSSPSPTIPHPSLSRPFDSAERPPRLFHSLRQERNSVLSLAADSAHLFSGGPTGDISVWDKDTLKLKATLRGHTGSILALEYAADKDWLFSASGDSTIRVWSTRTLSPLYLINPHGENDAGDLFSLVWCPVLQTVYFGCQDTSLQWFTFPSAVHSQATSPSSVHFINDDPTSSGRSTPTSSRRAHKFFDSYPQYTRRPADLFARNPTCSNFHASQSNVHTHGVSLPPTPPSSSSSLPSTSGSPPRGDPSPHRPLVVLQVEPSNVIYSAHYGYIYCMALVPSVREGSDDPPFDLASERRDLQLVTGSGDESVKLWQLAPANPTPILLHTFECCMGAVLAVVVRGETIYAGCQDGHLKVWDLETRTLVRVLITSENVDILSLSMLKSDLYVCLANGEVQRWSAQFEHTASWKAHDGIVLTSIVTRLCAPAAVDEGILVDGDAPEHDGIKFALVTGANDDQMKIWEVDPPKARKSAHLSLLTDPDMEWGDSGNETMVYALSKFVSIPSVSNSPAHREDCRQAAIWLRKCFTQLGAEACLLPTGETTNPLVLGNFRGNQTKRRRPRILFYGHYDVIAASHHGWYSDPFTLTGRNGYLYGRGATDNKGPVMAVACAAAELLGRRALDLDLVMLIEGEEEAGSGGFVEAVKRNKNAIGPVDAILVSNSTWIAEDTPCITYGLRGVVHCNVQISSEGPDRHSGVDGGVTVEPMLDMLKLLGTLTDGQNMVSIPGFYDNVLPCTDQEKGVYAVLANITKTPAAHLSSRWREPSLTVHNVEVSGPRNSTVIPATVKAHVSVRIVPDQDLETIANSLREHLTAAFVTMQSPNKLKVSIDHTADWWLGDLDGPWFHALETAVQAEWGVEPLRIREGGSIPSVPYLEKEFSCHALHLPLGQSSDEAHLPNERISLSNLRRGKQVVERFLLNVGKSDLPRSPTDPDLPGLNF
ncbi:Zn-dependent exopeptidase [Fomitopsis serialis]|uniref:Zn-dependent exopeptidase n=1 Tax=Fomitopsis serialis TaxID=139415 RepID=UPI0020087C3E|nr:Zn-dependent exopeptidase [Neoantrodia serialis]KAH9917958.1 Zn-dependent exopeptidase [Neoantrodia serialis]